MRHSLIGINIKRMNFKNTVQLVNKMLTDNKEWISRFTNYADEILMNLQAHVDGRSRFQEPTQFTFHTAISNLKETGVLRYDIRFFGQSVAIIKIKKGDVVISTSKKDSNNLKYFGVDIPLRDDKWSGGKARRFRKEFKNCREEKGRSPEHKMEAMLLSEFKRTDRSTKSLCNIQPVLLAKCFFQMATPLKASSKEISYSNTKGGIDILSRVRHKDNSTRLCVMELKDEYTKSEPPEKVMQQAVAYATFIANLLRSDSGDKWYQIFGFKGSTPENLTIDVAIVMPSPANGMFEDFNKERIEVLDNTFIEIYALYFNEKDKFFGGDSFGFIGSLKDAMMK